MTAFRAQFVCLLVLMGSAAFAADQVTFTKKSAAGDKISFTQTMAMDAAINVSANGQVVQQMQQKTTQLRLGTATIEAVDANGKPTKATYVFDEKCGGEVSVPGQGSQPVPTSLKGKTITVTRTGEKDLNFSEQVDEAGAIEVKEMFSQDHTMFPKTAVSVGDSWDIDPSELKNMVPPGSNMDAKAKGKLVSVQTVAGRQVANVELTITMSGGMQGMTMKSDLVGKGTVDVLTSQPIEVEIAGPMKASGRQQSPNGPVDFSMDGKMVMTMKSARQGGGAGPAVVVDPANPLGNPVNPLNPLGQAPAKSPLADTFSNDKMSVKLTSGAGGWSGTIKSGDKEFPISTATVEGTKVTGKFSAGGNAFDFDATLQGDTLTLNTGGATHVLKRADGNPLGR